MRRSVTTIALLLLAACSAPPPPAPMQPRAVAELARWRAYDDGQLLGHLVELEIRDPAGPVRMYRVEDPAGRIVGSATAAGRFSRRVPFQAEEEDVGVFALPRGVARLFGRDRPVTLRPVAADTREASVGRR